MRKTIGHYLIMLVVVIVVNFFLPRLLPGSPVRSIMGADVGALSAEERMGISEEYDLDKPLGTQFVIYIKNLFTLNWGTSFSKRQPIRPLIAAAAGWTLLLAGSSIVLSTLIGSLLGAMSALRRKKHRDLPLVFGTTLVSSIPPFWAAMILLAVFGVTLGWFPLYGAYSMWDHKTGLWYILDVAHHLVLPLAVLVVTSLMNFFTTTRYSVLNIVNEDYVNMASVRGIPPRHIRRWYIMRNALIPVFTVFMMDVGYLLSGSVLIETVFSYPGLGSLMQGAVTARDYPLIQYTFLIAALMTLAALLISDLLYKRIDPSMEGRNDE